MAAQKSSQGPTLEGPLNLSRAIFTPFKGFSLDAPPITDPTRITENVISQQALVRSQMISMIETRANALISKAEADIAALLSVDERLEQDDRDINRKKRDIDEMIKRMRIPMRPGSDPKEYVLRQGVKFLDETGPNNNDQDADGDIPMEDSTSSYMHRPTTAGHIKSRLSRALQDLIDQGVAQLENYDKHADRVLRGLGWKNGNPPTSAMKVNTSTGGITGILKNRDQRSPVDMNMGNGVRRLSTGMPISGSMGPPERRRESIEDLTRRGSR